MCSQWYNSSICTYIWLVFLCYYTTLLLFSSLSTNTSTAFIPRLLPVWPLLLRLSFLIPVFPFPLFLVPHSSTLQINSPLLIHISCPSSSLTTTATACTLLPFLSPTTSSPLSSWPSFYFYPSHLHSFSFHFNTLQRKVRKNLCTGCIQGIVCFFCSFSQ